MKKNRYITDNNILVVHEGLYNQPEIKERLNKVIAGLQSIVSDDNNAHLCDCAIHMSYLQSDLESIAKDTFAAHNVEKVSDMSILLPIE